MFQDTPPLGASSQELTSQDSGSPDIRCVLYASDFGPDSRKGYRLAMNLARRHQARLIFLHVIEPIGQTAALIVNSYMTSEQFAAMQSEGVEKVRQEIHARIARFNAEEVPAGSELSRGAPECRIERGKPSARILAVAQEVGADLIVMGTRTHSALSQLMVGSTAHQVLLRSSRPVLIVPMGDAESDRREPSPRL